MTAEDATRRDELTLAAASGSLSPTDQAELDVLRAEDASVDEKIEALRSVLARLDALEEWDEEPLPAGLEARVLAAVTTASAATARPRQRTRWRAALVAASAVLVAGAVGGALLVGVGGDDEPPPVGALGVSERLQVDGVAAGIALRASVVPHRWGTEAVLEADGLDPGREYDLVVVEDDGVEVPAGGFLGSRGTVHCHLNAPVLRADVSLLQVREPDGTIVGWARLPRPTR